MIGYQEFARLSQSSDSDERGHAAHLAALAYLGFDGPADEHAALYAALVSFLDDPSVKVRAALAYGLLHAERAPRPILLALMHDSGVIARAVLQYSPVLVDADLVGMVHTADVETLFAIAQRDKISRRLARALIDRAEDGISLGLLRRSDVEIDPDLLDTLANRHGQDAAFRGALLARKDLGGHARLLLVKHATDALRGCRMVSGALAAERLNSILRDGNDTAISAIGEGEVCRKAQGYVEQLVGAERLNTRLLLHAMVTGHVMFFAACVAELAGVSQTKTYSILESGSRPALRALFGRCGLSAALCGLFVRLIMHARSADLADDVAARHFVVTALTEDLIAEYEGDIPTDLEEAFAYLGEQNIALARKAARGVMAAFAETAVGVLSLPRQEDERLHLPAA
ncbi:DUF2336 domain-containing protein [Devosia sp. PTR5]|uniref:DUF2336 domain-containing protein n=1 Tax=Devosia oryzisoli TaxID=2774138 RepID=A0A927FT08_9HYPH|nr:DUF2336 domain-containing protein [Devosia oryzisoli]MBD8064393.1 DUF2336 domain-containing protein [Devosia oryzisoli]